MKCVEYITVEALGKFRGCLLPRRLIYYEFLLQTDKTPKLLKYLTDIDHSSILYFLMISINLIWGYFANKDFKTLCLPAFSM